MTLAPWALVLLAAVVSLVHAVAVAWSTDLIAVMGRPVYFGTAVLVALLIAPLGASFLLVTLAAGFLLVPVVLAVETWWRD